MTQHRGFRNFAQLRAGRVVSGAGYRGRAWAALLAALLGMPCALAQAPPPAGAVQLLGQGTVAGSRALGLLARALSETSGVAVTSRRSVNALAHWRALLAGESAGLVLEEAQFVDYRVRHQGFAAIARTRRDARFAVIVAPGTLVSGLSDLRTRRLAVRAPPALAALRIHELFPDPVLAPVLVPLPQGLDPVGWIVNGKVDAAMVRLEQAEAAIGARIVLVTDALPRAGITLSRNLDHQRRRALRRAVTGLGRHAAGRLALAALEMEAFEPAGEEDFDGAARLLRGTWPSP